MVKKINKKKMVLVPAHGDQCPVCNDPKCEARELTKEELARAKPLREHPLFKKKSSVSEAEAGIHLQYCSTMGRVISPLLSEFTIRLIHDWFDARRAAGLGSYSEESLPETIRRLKK